MSQTQYTEGDEVTIVTRRSLLPLWIKIFIWLFLIFGALLPIGFVYTILDLPFNLSLYGYETNDPRSLASYFILALFLYKFIVALSLWRSKVYAIILAEIDAISGILICCTYMILGLMGDNDEIKFHFNLELFVLIPYLIKMRRVRKAWKNAH